MALTRDPLFWQLGIVFGVILLGGLGYSVMSGRPVPTVQPDNPYTDLKEQTAYNTEVNQNLGVGGSRKRKGKGKKKKQSKKH
jgi:hypothetical protein